MEVIKHLKQNSAPGPDGFSVRCYKKFANKLVPYMVRFFLWVTHLTHLTPPFLSPYIPLSLETRFYPLLPPIHPPRVHSYIYKKWLVSNPIMHTGLWKEYRLMISVALGYPTALLINYTNALAPDLSTVH